MLGLENVINLVKTDFYSKKSSDPCYDFFYSSALAHLISLEIASSTYANKCMSYKDLCKKMPSKLGCRSTIYSTWGVFKPPIFFYKEEWKLLAHQQERLPDEILIFALR